MNALPAVSVTVDPALNDEATVLMVLMCRGGDDSAVYCAHLCIDAGADAQRVPLQFDPIRVDDLEAPVHG